MPHEAKLEYQHSVHPPPFLLGLGGRGLNLQPNFQKRGGGLTGPQLLDGIAGKEGGNFFLGWLQFSHKK